MSAVSIAFCELSSGLVLIAYAIPIGFPHTGWNAVGWIGVIPFLTAIVGSCPLYSVIGLSTRARS